MSGASRARLLPLLLGGLTLCQWCLGTTAAADAEDAGSCRLAKLSGREEHFQVEGLEERLPCYGFAQQTTCCRPEPLSKAVQLLSSYEESIAQQLSQLDEMLEMLPRMVASLAMQAQLPTAGPCHGSFAEFLQARSDFLQMAVSAGKLSAGWTTALLQSQLCALCYPVDDNVTAEKLWRDSADQLTALAAELHSHQLQVMQVDAAQDQSCLPPFLLAGLDGVSLPRGQQARQDAIAALNVMRDWPLQRRESKVQGGSASAAEDLLSHFNEDMAELGRHLMNVAVQPAAAVAHQAHLLTTSIQSSEYWQSHQPLATVLLPSGILQMVLPQEAEESPDLEALPALPAPGLGSRDAREAFGLVVLISNRSSDSLMKQLFQRLEGPHVLFLEDTCGSATEALGQGCHSGGPEQERCLRPSHGRHLVEAYATLNESMRAHIAWRRHASTMSIAQTAWELAKSYWSSECSAWLADLRFLESDCPGAPPLHQDVETVYQGRLEIMKKPEVYFGLTSSSSSPPPAGAVPVAARPVWQAARDSIANKLLFEAALQDYVKFHKQSLKKMARAASSSSATSSSDDAGGSPGVLVYSCQAHVQCGGHGDRLNGIVTTFLLAMLTRRVFLIDSISPLPLQNFLSPDAIDWQMKGWMPPTAAFRHFSFHDKRHEFEADVGRFTNYSDKTLVITMNYRLIRTLWESPAFAEKATAMGLPEHAPRFLVARVFETLFTPSPLLQQQVDRLRQQLGGLEDRRFVAIHLRTGKVAYDPSRHGVEQLRAFFDCARQAERDLSPLLQEDGDGGAVAGLPWLLATDSAEVVEFAASLPEAALPGKLRIPDQSGRVHIDRSDLTDTLGGIAANYAEWYLFSRAAAVVLSRSFFGETAAEVGRVTHAYFGPSGCVRTDLGSS